MPRRDPLPPPPKPLDREALASSERYLRSVARRQFPHGLHAKEGASDQAQEALKAAWEARDQYQGRTVAELRGWLRGILANVIRKFIRRYVTQGRAHDREVQAGEGPGLAHPAHSDTPSRLVSQREAEEQVARAVTTLSEHEQSVIALHCQAGMTFAEIARELDRAPAAIGMTYHRALERLRGLLGARPA